MLDTNTFVLVVSHHTALRRQFFDALPAHFPDIRRDCFLSAANAEDALRLVLETMAQTYDARWLILVDEALPLTPDGAADAYQGIDLAADMRLALASQRACIILLGATHPSPPLSSFINQFLTYADEEMVVQLFHDFLEGVL